MPVPREQLRMTAEELDTFLATQRTLRCATVSQSGDPHVVPLWFVWHGGAVWLNSLRRSRRSRDLEEGSRVALCVDAGEDYRELRGATIYGRAVDASDASELDEVRAKFGAKYWGGAPVPEMRSHRWLVVRPDRIVSWNFAKIPTGADRRVQALEAHDRT